MSVRNVLIVLNVLVVVAMGVIAIILLQRHRDEERTPANQTPFLDDDELEGRRLERVLGWSLIAAAIIAVSLPVYWLWEPTRQEKSEEYFANGAKERGEVLFSNPSMELFDSATSLQCANCHGTDAGGGSAPSVYTDDNGTPDDPDDDVSQRVEWRAPPLNTVLLRFDEDEVRQIITYGRPGTPMQGFGVEGGGPKNTQSIGDLIAYLSSIQLSPKEAQQQAMTALFGDEGDPDNPDDDIVGARDQAARQVEDAQAALDEAEKALADVEDDPKATDAQLDRAREAVDDARADLEWAQEWAARREGVTDGQFLFELYCARCHTLSWSIFDPTVRSLDGVIGPAGGGGSLGFNLRDGQMQRRFPDEEEHVTFITEGSEANAPYGNGGIGSGRMPGFGDMLTDDMIRAIVGYERDCLEVTDPSQPASEQLTREDVPACDPPDVPEADK